MGGGPNSLRQPEQKKMNTFSFNVANQDSWFDEVVDTLEAAGFEEVDPSAGEERKFVGFCESPAQYAQAAGDGVEVFGFSGGRYSLIDYIEAMVDAAPAAGELVVSTWAAAAAFEDSLEPGRTYRQLAIEDPFERRIRLKKRAMERKLNQLRRRG